jgi:PHD/YefM family antitoxin component YafN of YafNO toxin-antitoxin module
MMKTNALQIRQSFGKILRKLLTTHEPIIIEKGREPVAVLISLKTFKERFIDYREQQKRDELLQRFSDSAQQSTEDSLKVLREVRYGSDH